MTHHLLIPTAGQVIRFGQKHDARDLATMFVADALSVVTAHWPGLGEVGVMFIDDWGATKQLPVNRKAWYLYGASPIHGDVLFTLDSRAPIDPAVIEWIEHPDFVPPDALAAMERWLENNE